MESTRLIQILLPVHDNEKKPFPPDHYTAIADELTDRFGGVTTYSQAPAEGLWQDGSATVADTIIVMEVMIEQPDLMWWREFRERLELRFKQDQIIIRSIPIDLL